MANVLHIAGRELRSYLSSPWTYVVLAAAVFILGFFFAFQVAWFAEMCNRPTSGNRNPIRKVGASITAKPINSKRTKWPVLPGRT